MGDTGELISEQTHFLLTELQALLFTEGLLEQQRDTVVVAAKLAYNEYLSLAAYICQPRRSFQHGLTRMAFYRNMAIQPEIPLILSSRDNLDFTKEAVSALRSEGTATGAELASLVESVLKDGSARAGGVYQVFLLTPADDPRTLRMGKVDITIFLAGVNPYPQRGNFLVFGGFDGALAYEEVGDPSCFMPESGVPAGATS